MKEFARQISRFAPESRAEKPTPALAGGENSLVPNLNSA
jgi:hypothetical protein